MRSTKIRPRGALGATLLASIAMAALPAGSQALASKTHVATGNVSHLRGSTALLNGIVYPAGNETSYFFEYGPTSAYGSQTPTGIAGSGTARVPVGDPIAGLTPGAVYHYNLVALADGQTIVGHDRTFLAGGAPSTRLVFKIAKPAPATYGTPFLFSGTLSGLGSANAAIALQESPYPYLEPFVNVGAAGTTNSVGAFSFRISNLAVNTQFRVVTIGKLPVYSTPVTEHVAIAVTLHVHPTKRKGFVHMYGFVTPSKLGTPVQFQLEKAVRPTGVLEEPRRFVTQTTTVLRRGGQTFSRFSAIVEIHHAGRYRAYVTLPKGPLVSGASNSVVIRGTVPAKLKHHRK